MPFIIMNKFVGPRHHIKWHVNYPAWLFIIVSSSSSPDDCERVSDIGGVFLLRQTDLTDLARCVCRSFIRPSVSFLVF